MQDHHVGHQLVVLDHLALLVANVLRDDPVPAKEQPLHEVVEFFALVRGGIDRLAKFGIVDVLQEKYRAHRPSKFPECVIQPVLAAGGAKATQDGRRCNLAGLNGNDNAQHVFQVARDQRPVDVAAEQAADVLVLIPAVASEKHQILDVPNSGHQIDAQEMRQSKNGRALGLRVAMQGIRLNV